MILHHKYLGRSSSCITKRLIPAVLIQIERSEVKAALLRVAVFPF